MREEINLEKMNQGQTTTRTCPVIPELRSLLQTWQPRAGQIYLFPGRHPEHHWRHIQGDSAADILQNACKRIGLEGVSTHSFRRTALTQMSNAGVPLRVIQEISGHRTLTVLQRYLDVKPEQVKGAIATLSLLSSTSEKLSLTS